MKAQHIHSSDLKLKHFGYGEWVEEPDFVEFEHLGFLCIVIRVFNKEPFIKKETYFGGHLCAYVRIPENHPWYKKGYDEIEVDIHGGLSFSSLWKDEKTPVANGYYIGFDCAHSMDICPSINLYIKTNPYMKRLCEKYPLDLLPKPYYKNIEFVINECKLLANQAKEAQRNTQDKFQET